MLCVCTERLLLKQMIWINYSWQFMLISKNAKYWSDSKCIPMYLLGDRFAICNIHIYILYRSMFFYSIYRVSSARIWNSVKIIHCTTLSWIIGTHLFVASKSTPFLFDLCRKTNKVRKRYFATDLSHFIKVSSHLV